MLPLQYTRRWQAASLMLLLFVLAGTLMPAVWFWSDRATFISWFMNVDKWLHAITFGVLALWFSGQYRPGAYWRVGIGLILFGVLIEFCQRLVTYRSAELFDLVANTGGVVVGLSIAAAGVGGWSLRLEEWFARRNADADGD
ncbi:MAG: VanZ family protein [Woeseiaceae bacterium]